MVVLSGELPLGDLTIVKYFLRRSLASWDFRSVDDSGAVYYNGRGAFNRWRKSDIGCFSLLLTLENNLGNDPKTGDEYSLLLAIQAARKR